MPTFANDVNGNPPRYYVAVTLTNSQSGATGANFQCKVNVNSNAYSLYEASNLKNLNWQDGGGTIIKSWLESGETNTSTSTVYWVLLANSITGSGGTQIVYLVFYDTTATSKDNSVTGAEPNYTGTYGQYDSGANVFTSLYQNFTGTLTPTGWTQSGGTVNNGYTFPISYVLNSGIYTNSTFNSVMIDIYAINKSPHTSSSGNVGLGYSGNNINPSVDWELTGVGTTTVDVARTDTGIFSYDYGTEETITNTTGTLTPSLDVWHVHTTYDTSSRLIGIAGGNSGSFTNAPIVQWVRARVRPPSGVMPSASFGSISPTGTAGSGNIQSAATLRTNAYSMGVGNIASSATFSTNALAPGIGNISSTATVLSTIPLTTPSAGISSSVMVYINNPIASSAGVGTINMTVAIPFNSPIIPKTSYTAAFMATYLPPQTNVQSVNASSSNSITLTQTLSISASYSSPTLTTTVTDGQGHNIPNAIVSWSVTAGVATVSPASATTNSFGQATTTVTGTSSTVQSSVTLIGVTKTTTTSV